MKERALFASICLGFVACRSAGTSGAHSSASSSGQETRAAEARVIDDDASARPIDHATLVAEAEARARPRSQSRAERFHALCSEYDEALEHHWRGFHTRGPEPDEAELSKSWTKNDVPAFARRLQPILDEDPGDELAFDIVKWVIEEGEPELLGRDKLYAAIEFEHANRPELGPLLEQLDASDEPATVMLLQKMAAQSAAIEVQAHALYALARWNQEQARFIRWWNEPESESERGKIREFVAPARLKAILSADPLVLDEQASVLLHRVESEFGMVTREGAWGPAPLAEIARCDLFELEHLAIGSLAPDFEGRDLAGAAFRLSDDRGKVVLLAFKPTWSDSDELDTRLRQLAERLAAEPFAIVELREASTRLPVEQEPKAFGVNWRVVQNGSDPVPGLITKFCNSDLKPALFYLDPDGVIRHRDVRGGHEMDALIDEMLAEAKRAASERR